jgi:hypothetical protein
MLFKVPLFSPFPSLSTPSLLLLILIFLIPLRKGGGGVFRGLKGGGRSRRTGHGDASCTGGASAVQMVGKLIRRLLTAHLLLLQHTI